MPAQYIPAAQDQQDKSSETLQLLLLLKRQALEQKIAEHRLNVLGPLEDEFAKTNLDIAKFKLGEMKDLAPLQKQSAQVGLQKDTAQAQSAQIEAQNLPSLLAQQSRGNEARIASEQVQQQSAITSQQAMQQTMSQRAASFPVEQQSALLAQDATRQQIATSKEQAQTAVASRENQKKQLSLEKQQLVMHAAQSREGILLLKNHPEFAKDPEMSAYIHMLPNDVDPKSSDEFRARMLNNLMNSNDPLLASLKYDVINNTVESIGTGRGDKAQELAKIMGVGGATDSTKQELSDAVGKAYMQFKTQGPTQDTVQGNGQGDIQGDVFSTQPSTLKKGELGPEQGTPAVGQSVKSESPTKDFAKRVEYHVSQGGRTANTRLEDEQTGDIQKADRYYGFITATPINPESGLKLDYDASISSSKGTLKVYGKNSHYDKTELENFVTASTPAKDATAGQIGAFSAMLSDAATQEHPEKLIASYLSKYTFTPSQINALEKLSQSVGWNLATLTAMIKKGG